MFDLFPSILGGWIDVEVAAATAVATTAVLINVPTSGWDLFWKLLTVVFGIALSPLRAESSESYSSSLLLDDVRK
jgi:hypothetical protein